MRMSQSKCHSAIGRLQLLTGIQPVAFGANRGVDRSCVRQNVLGAWIRGTGIRQSAGLPHRRVDDITRHHCIEEAGLRQAGCSTGQSGQHERDSGRWFDEPWQSLRPAAAGNQPERDFRQANLCRITSHPPMTRQSELQAAPEREALDRRNHGLAAGVDGRDDVA